MALKGYFYVGLSLCRPCESDIFGVRAAFGVGARHIFPQHLLAIIPLTCNVIGVIVSRTWALWWAGPPLFSEAVTALLGAGSAHSIEVEALKVVFDQTWVHALPLKRWLLMQVGPVWSQWSHVLPMQVSARYSLIHISFPLCSFQT